ncbi:hypothetical protein CEXT_508531 [Caerostris extrusa]|uniref:SAM-dependent MTase RsmB/NOP-type domain-containing protein n=1 Tax=Caerostris extrusa TaxID=172846 RepID=A0AAV4MEQ4_CAEEX|nr:hypothetical protein CEXT_508531 [Caerostris extrusa]
MIDYHFKDLLVFSSTENLTTWSLFQKNHVYIQDKSNYIPVFALDPKPESVVIDACAAPGMKTIHIASLMENKGKIYAYEKNDNRFKILKNMLNDSCVEICEAECEDFYLVNTNNPKFQNLECILVDPTCSGSGMVNRMDTVTDTEDSKNVLRLQKLAGFQILLLKHALTFPSVKRVVYSTCSISEEENEYVVHEVLNHFRNMFKLVSVMPDWPFRGSDNYEFGKLCLRAHPEKTFTNGFFVAMFERLSYDEQQSVFLNNETFSNYGKSSKKKQRGNKDSQTENLNSNFVNENDNESKIFPSEENRNFLNNSSINNKSKKRKKLCIEETVNDLEISDQYQDKLKININSSEMYEEICDVEAENYSSYKLCQSAFENNKGEKKKHKKKHSKKDEETFDNLEIEAKVSSKSELSTSIISDQSNLISCDKVKKKKKKHKKEKEILDNLESIPEDHISDCELTSKLEIPEKKHKKHHKKHDRDLNEISQNADILDDQTLENYNAEEKSIAACEKLQHVQKKRKHDSLTISLGRNSKEDLIYENTCETMLDTVDALKET